MTAIENILTCLKRYKEQCPTSVNISAERTQYFFEDGVTAYADLSMSIEGINNFDPVLAVCEARIEKINLFLTRLWPRQGAETWLVDQNNKEVFIYPGNENIAEINTLNANEIRLSLVKEYKSIKLPDFKIGYLDVFQIS